MKRMIDIRREDEEVMSRKQLQQIRIKRAGERRVAVHPNMTAPPAPERLRVRKWIKAA